MISQVKGSVIHKNFNKVEIDVNGVGYEIFLSRDDLTKTKIDQKVILFTHHHVAENTNNLYGFLSRKDKRVFELLISVSGIGPKISIEIFSAGAGDRILRAISEADVEFFRQVKGLGKKGAQRIIVDLRQKVGAIKELDLTTDEGGNIVIYQALQGLGFKRVEIAQVLRKLPKTAKTEDEIIKFALKQFAKNG